MFQHVVSLSLFTFFIIYKTYNLLVETLLLMICIIGNSIFCKPFLVCKILSGWYKRIDNELYGRPSFAGPDGNISSSLVTKPDAIASSLDLLVNTKRNLFDELSLSGVYEYLPKSFF